MGVWKEISMGVRDYSHLLQESPSRICGEIHDLSRATAVRIISFTRVLAAGSLYTYFG